MNEANRVNCTRFAICRHSDRGIRFSYERDFGVEALMTLNFRLLGLFSASGYSYGIQGVCLQFDFIASLHMPR
jgi:hypothetical protein